jgi:hypothetical protein
VRERRRGRGQHLGWHIKPIVQIVFVFHHFYYGMNEIAMGFFNSTPGNGIQKLIDGVLFKSEFYSVCIPDRKIRHKIHVKKISQAGRHGHCNARQK